MAERAPLPWSTALVTGASAGIGTAMVRELAGRGLAHVVLVARRGDHLASLATELEQRWGTTAEVLAADLTDPVERGWVEARLAEPAPDAGAPAVDLLVNNAGFGTTGPFWKLDPDGEEREIDLNVTAVVRLCRAALPGLVARGRGAVLNVSSMASYQPSPGMATYSATKAFVTMFSESLVEELRGTGVTVTALLPGYTRTEFQAGLGQSGYDDAPGFMWMAPEQVAAAGVDAAAAGRALCVPGVLYKAAAALETPLPRTARRLLIGRLSRFDPDA